MWNGIFKSYEVYSVVPLTKMSAADWRWLEYENLSNIAKNRIAEKAGENFYGFANVRIFSKGKAKDRYIWPVAVEEAEAVLAAGLPEFGHFTDAEDLTTKAIALENNADYIGARLIEPFGAAVTVAIAKEVANERDAAQLAADLSEWEEAAQEGSDDEQEAGFGAPPARIYDFQGGTERPSVTKLGTFYEPDQNLALALELMKYYPDSTTLENFVEAVWEKIRLLEEADELLGLADDAGQL